MPKSRKTKAKYKDFQKVKLKIGKTLPKADNVTNTSFKSRGIHIKEQLKSTASSAEPVTRRKQDLQDLLSHCHHHNVTARHDAVTGLRELVIDDHNLLRTHLAVLVERVPDLCIDKDSAVRKAVHRFFKVALPHIPEHQIAPFFSILSAHLCCAMTHIDDEIQLDSLHLFDLFMEHYPRLLVTSNGNLLTNFIEQISRKSSSGGPTQKGAGRALLVNPNSKMSSRKGRVQVLERLHKFLKAVIEQKQPVLSTETSMSSDSFRCNTKHGPYHQPMGSTWINPSLMHRLIDSGSSSSRSVATCGTDILNSGKTLGGLLDVLLPLMLQCWIEVGPGQLSTDLPGNVMGRDAMSTLGSILKVIHLLLQCVQLCDTDTDLMQTVRESYLNDFVQHYMPSFPYSMHEAPVSDKKKAAKVEQPTISVLSLNLTVCEMMSYFADSAVGQTPPSWLTKLTTFAVQATKQALDFDQLQSLLRFIGKLLDCKLDQERQEELMGCACALFTSRNRLSRDRLLLLDFISHHVTSANSEPFLRMPCVRKWLASLPHILVQSCGHKDDVTKKIIHIIRQIAPLSQKPLLDALQKHCLDMIKLLDQLSPGLQGDLVEVLYWVPVWTRSQLQALARVTHHPHLLPAHFHKLMLGLIYRYQRGWERGDQELVFEHADLYSFLLVVLVGKCAEDLQTDESRINPDVLDTWAVRMQYSQVIGSLLLQLPNTNQVITLLIPAVTNVFEKYSSDLPLSSVVSLLRVITGLYQAHSGIIPSQRPAVVTAMVTTTSQLVTATAEAGAPSTDRLVGESLSHSVSWQRVRDATVDSCLQLLICSPETVLSFVAELLHRLADCSDEDAVFSYVHVVSRLHHDNKLRPAMVGHCQPLRTIIDQLQDKVPILESRIWWSDLKYEVSLMQPKHT